MPSMSNLNRIAKLAGVSIVTVTRVLSGTYPVAPATRARVMAAVAELDVPSMLKQFRRNDSRTILVLFSDYHPVVFRGIQSMAADYGYIVHLHQAQYESSIADIKRIVESSMAEASLFINIQFRPSELSALAARIPVVQIGEVTDYPGGCSATIDEETAAYDITRHLLEHGRKHIGCMLETRGDFLPSYSQSRLKGFKRAMIESGLEIKPGMVKTADHPQLAEQLGRDMARFRQASQLDGMICFDDRLAAAFIRGLVRNGVQVPNDVSVAGFGDSEIASLTLPSLTTVAQPFRAIGEEAVELLIDMIRDSTISGKHIVLPHQVTVRESTIPQS